MTPEFDKIFISHPVDMPQVMVHAALADFHAAEIPLQIDAREPQPMAAMEDYIPTAIVLIIAKPFLDAFLKKAGEDAYGKLKQAVIRCYSVARTITVTFFVSAAKKAGRSPFSRTFSVYSKAADGTSIKFLFSTETTDQSLDVATGKMLELIRAGGPPLPSTEHQRMVVLLVYDVPTSTWQPKSMI
ncbi:MAG TPA: hypothetical protein PKX00_03465 [Opitutaceae bacterium]|nr:hypothetical protein [Opitutaceae bacterium]